MTNIIIFHGQGCTPESHWYNYVKEYVDVPVQIPAMPDDGESLLSSWLSYALDNFKYDSETILIGHSAGCPLILSILENISSEVKQVIFVAGFSDEMMHPILQESYDWNKIKSNCSDFVFFNSVDDPYGCDVKQGKILKSHLGGDLVAEKDQGHFGSSQPNGTYTMFPKLLEYIDSDL